MPYSAPGPFLGAQSASTAYQVSRSLRFRSSASAYLSRTFGTATSATTWTWSGWVKRGALGATQALFGAYTDANNFSYFMFNSSDQLRLYVKSATVVTGDIATTAVYRDTSAWCHVLLSKTGTTFSLYVNGVSVSWSGTAPPSAGIINNATPHYLGQYGGAGTYFDGYLAEVNFIDGQSLTPSSFGQSNALTGVWEPKAYAGSYGTNGFYLPFSASATSSFAASFNGSTQTLATATNSNLALGTSDFTIECWIQPSAASSYTAVGFGNGATVYDAFPFYMSSGNLVTYLSSTGGSWDISNAQVIATSIPTTTWSHVALTRSGSTFRAYFNGVQAYTFTSSASIYQSTNAITIAKGQGAFYFAGSISNLRFVKGTALYTSNFTPSAQPLTAVTNTQLLTLQSSTIVDNSANALTITNTGSVTTSAATPWGNFIAGQDSSGAGNNWSSANINVTSSGTTYDSMIDSPTNYADGGNGRGNYAVLNPLMTATNSTVSDGNLATAATAGAAYKTTTASLGVSSGKWYWECYISACGANFATYIGVIKDITTPLTTFPGNTASSYGYDPFQGKKFNNGTGVTYGSTFAAGDTISVALDLDNGKLWWAKNGTWQASGDPAAGTNAAYTSLSGTFFAIVSMFDSGDKVIVNFGQRPFAYTPPSGFSALNTQNLPAPALTPSP